MKFSKTLIALALGATAATAAIGVTAADQAERWDPEARIQQRVERMGERLGLSDEQRTRVEALMREHAEQRRAMREASREQLNAILTEEQRVQLEQMREERRERRAERREARGPHHGQHRGKHHRRGDCPAQGGTAS